MTLEGTNTYVVGADPAYVIDPGPADREHVGVVRRVGEDRGGIAGVLLTHSHADHSAAVPMLEVPVLWGEVSSEDELALPPGADGRALAADRIGPFEVLPTPGHAADHVCFLLDGVGFCGDLVLGRGSSIVLPGGGALVAYLDSLRRLREGNLELLCPGHGPWIPDPRERLDEYRVHRTDREERLLAALEAGERSRERLLDTVWYDVPEPLRPAAAVAMEAHLEKLGTEGRLPADIVD
jgi:glyoxylase-like metal-dependent hydrolase (beta-lactamase superfamily II)